MAIGAPIIPSEINDRIGQLAISLRNDCSGIVNLQNTVVQNGGQSGLVAAGFSAQDAASFVTALNQLNTIAVIYFGQATQATQFNFNQASAGLTAGR